MEFSYGKAPLAILILALISGLTLLTGNVVSHTADSRPPDLIMAIFAPEHRDAYVKVIPDFEKKYNVKIQLQLVSQDALQQRLASAMEVGAGVPDMVECLDGTMGYFTKGPLDDVGFVDLTSQLHSFQLDGKPLFDQLVQSRFGKWSSRGRIFALPHDVHPVMLCYRRDLVEQEGIDVAKLTTWDEFTRVGRELVARHTKQADGDSDRYMIDMPSDGGDILRLLMLQRGVSMFNTAGEITYDDPRTVDTVIWYIKQIEGRDRIAFPVGWDQQLYQAMHDGLALFYFTPDWRTKAFQMNMADLSGKLAVMPLPAWEPGGIRTSTWGGTGLAITKACQQRGKFDLAWKLAMFLYYDKDQLGGRYENTNILPPLTSAWTLPQFSEPREYFSNIRLGQVYSELAKYVPAEPSSPFQTLARDKLGEAFTNTSQYYKDHGDKGLQEFALAQLHSCAEQVRQSMQRNQFLKTSDSAKAAN